MSQVKHIVSAYRFRSYFCQSCNVYIEVYGNDPLAGACKCGVDKASAFVLQVDQNVSSSKTVTSNKIPK